MKTMIIAGASFAATLALAGCSDPAPVRMTESDTPQAGDPAVYAPDGWPLEIGDRITFSERGMLFNRFPNRGGIFAVRSVGGALYSAHFSDYVGARGLSVYEGHFRHVESETFDPETIYEVMRIGGRLSRPGELAMFWQFVSEEAKRRFADNLAEDAVNRLVPLSLERAAQVRNNKRVVQVMGVTSQGHWKYMHAYNYIPPTLRELYGPDRRESEV